MAKTRLIRILPLILLVISPHYAQAMGLRSFVALPVNRGGVVLRQQFLHNSSTDVSGAITNAAWGLTGKDTLLFGLPYRLSPSGSNRVGDFSLLYRRTLWQVDSKYETSRFALLAGAILATDSERDSATQLGFVTTFYRDRNSLDIDILYRWGMGSRRDDGRYDVSWQYRLSPPEYAEWGFTREWFSVIELNGRWQDGRSIDHQMTVGLQWVHNKWVLEGGVIQTLNNNQDTQYLISTRLHF